MQLTKAMTFDIVLKLVLVLEASLFGLWRQHNLIGLQMDGEILQLVSGLAFSSCPCILAIFLLFESLQLMITFAAAVQHTKNIPNIDTIEIKIR